MKREHVEDRVRDLLIELGLDITNENFKETPRRIGEWLLDFTKSPGQIAEECEAISEAQFPATDDDMVVIRPFTVFSMCPHHLLPVEYRVAIGYLPNGSVIGISKLVRLADTVAKQPILQEDYASILADVLCDCLGTKHVAVMTVGTHSCMKIRGVKQDTEIVKSAVRGLLRSNPSLNAEFYNMLGGR